jgi:hypothetical protein
LQFIQAQLGMPTRLLQAWGPSCRVQADFDGRPIQHYLTMLVRVSGGRYLLVGQIIDLDRISRRVPNVVELSEREAQWWIANLSLELVRKEEETRELEIA